MDRMRALIEDCCGWNRKTWADAVEFAVATLPVDLSGYSVLEIGASDRSTLAPVSVAKGADVGCSYCRKPKDLIENGSLRRICSKYGLASPPVHWAHHADKLVAGLFRPTGRTVFSTVIRALPAAAS